MTIIKKDKLKLTKSIPVGKPKEIIKPQKHYEKVVPLSNENEIQEKKDKKEKTKKVAPEIEKEKVQ